MDSAVARRRLSSAVSSGRFADAPISYDVIPSQLDAAAGRGGGSVEISDSTDMMLREVHIVEEKEDFAQRLAATRGDFHFYIMRIVDHSVFNSFIMFIILCNTITLGIESTFVAISRDPNSTLHSFILYCDAVFLAVYTVEFLLKVTARPAGYWQSAFNLFDFLILVLSMFDMIANTITNKLASVGAIKVFRVFRALRALRTASFIRGLRVLLAALITTIKSSVSVFILLVLVIFVFDVLAIFLFGYENSSVRHYFLNLNQATLSLMCLVTADGWTDLQGNLDSEGRAGKNSRFFTGVFMLFGNFIFTNIFIAVIINNIQDSDAQFRAEVAAELAQASRDKKHRILERKEQEQKHMHLAIIREQKSQFHNYDDLLRNINECVKEHDESPVNAGDFSLNLLWITSLLTSLDHYDNITYSQAKLYQEMALLLSKCYELRHDEHEAEIKKREEEHAAAMAAAFPTGINNSNLLKLFGAAMLQAGNTRRGSVAAVPGVRKKRTSTAYGSGGHSLLQSSSGGPSMPGILRKKSR